MEMAAQGRHDGLRTQEDVRRITYAERRAPDDVCGMTYVKKRVRLTFPSTHSAHVIAGLTRNLDYLCCGDGGLPLFSGTGSAAM